VLFTPHDIEALVRRARDLAPTGQQPPLVYSTLFGLLASTGMRISEALALWWSWIYFQTYWLDGTFV
jgi:integrase